MKCDKRSIEYEALPEVQARLLERHAAWLRSELDLAKDFGAILESGHYYDEDCAGLVEYARKFRYDGRRAMTLARLGQAMGLEPGLEDEIVSGRIPLESGPRLFDVFSSATLRAKADWLALARTLTPGGLSAHVRRLQEEEAQGTVELRSLQFLVTEPTRDGFRRLQHLLQAKKGRKLTDGEVFTEAVNDSLNVHDPVVRARRLLAKARARAAADPEGAEARKARLAALGRELTERNRHIPAPLVYEVLDRSDGRCEVPGCARHGPVQIMHMLVGYAEGGEHHLRNIGLGCPGHHRLVDGGRLKCIGFTPDERPAFEDSKGRLLYPDPRPPPPKT